MVNKEVVRLGQDCPASEEQCSTLGLSDCEDMNRYWQTTSIAPDPDTGVTRLGLTWRRNHSDTCAGPLRRLVTMEILVTMV